MCLVHVETSAQVINGSPLSIVNPATLSNPECLSSFAEIGDVLRREVN